MEKMGDKIDNKSQQQTWAMYTSNKTLNVALPAEVYESMSRCMSGSGQSQTKSACPLKKALKMY